MLEKLVQAIQHFLEDGTLHSRSAVLCPALSTQCRKRVWCFSCSPGISQERTLCSPLSTEYVARCARLFSEYSENVARKNLMRSDQFAYIISERVHDYHFLGAEKRVVVQYST